MSKDECPDCGAGLHYAGNTITKGYKSVDDVVELFFDCPDCGNRYIATYIFNNLVQE